MSTFRIGQKVVCTSVGWTVNIDTPTNGPALDEICTVKDFGTPGYLVLKEHTDPFYENGEVLTPCYEAKFFRPLTEHSASVSIEVIQSLPLTVKETIDTPQPETV